MRHAEFPWINQYYPLPSKLNRKELGGFQPSLHGYRTGCDMLETTSTGSKYAQAKEKF